MSIPSHGFSAAAAAAILLGSFRCSFVQGNAGLLLLSLLRNWELHPSPTKSSHTCNATTVGCPSSRATAAVVVAAAEGLECCFLVATQLQA